MKSLMLSRPIGEAACNYDQATNAYCVRGIVQFANFAGTDLDGFFTKPQVRCWLLVGVWPVTLPNRSYRHCANGALSQVQTRRRVLPQAFSIYMAYLKKMATRVNTFTGVVYKNDPTIFAWDLLNEPRYPADQQPDRAPMLCRPACAACDVGHPSSGSSL